METTSTAQPALPENWATYTVWNIWKLPKPDRFGGYSELTFKATAILGGFLLPLVPLVVGIVAARSESPVKKLQGRSLMLTGGLVTAFYLARSLGAISRLFQ